MAQKLIFAEILEAHKKLPAQTQFVQTGALNTANRKKFNKVLQNVSVANDNAEVVIMGTMVGLQELEGLIDINWIAFCYNVTGNGKRECGASLKLNSRKIETIKNK